MAQPPPYSQQPYNPNAYPSYPPQPGFQQQPGTLRVFWPLSTKWLLSAGFGYQAPPAMPVYAPTGTAPAAAGGYNEDGLPKNDGVGFSNKSIRAGFIRKVRVVGFLFSTFASRRFSRLSRSVC